MKKKTKKVKKKECTRHERNANNGMANEQENGPKERTVLTAGLYPELSAGSVLAIYLWLLVCVILAWVAGCPQVDRLSR